MYDVQTEYSVSYHVLLYEHVKDFQRISPV